MHDITIRAYTLPEAYHESLMGFVSADGTEMAVTIQVLEPFAEPRISRMWPGGPQDLERYRRELVDGILDFEVETGNWDYTYHQRFSKWIDFVIWDLKRDPNSRRAVISVRDNEADAYSDNPACLQHIQFMIRNGKLDMFVLFRSNDAVRACFMNMYGLTELQKYVADQLGVPVGVYTHRANSFHIYPESLNTWKGYVKRIIRGKNLTFNYIGEWDELMAETVDDIENMVRKQEQKVGN